jgi:hypothetical protein
MSSFNQVPDLEVPAKARTRRYSAAEKSRILAEYKVLGQAGKGALLRREGIYSSLIAAWRARRDQVDIYAPYTIGWLIADRESAVVAEQLLGDATAKHGIDRDTLTLHADNGSSTAPKPVAFLLADLGVTKSHSRQHTSNDNPLSKAQFRYGHAGEVSDGPCGGAGRRLHPQPERFVRKHPQQVALPIAAWINKPPDTTQTNRPSQQKSNQPPPQNLDSHRSTPCQNRTMLDCKGGERWDG